MKQHIGLPMAGRPHLWILQGRSGPTEYGPRTDAEARAERVTLRATCPECGSTEVLSLDAAAAVRWVRGALIQDEFPDLTPAQRERLISGICSACWDVLTFGDPDADDETDPDGE